MSMENLNDLFIDKLKDIYHAEKQLTKALPKMAKAASCDELRAAFESHLAETQDQVERLEKIFKILGMPARGKACKAMEGLVEEGGELMETKAEACVLDAGLICAAQSVEHYEMAVYGTLVTWAGILDQEEIASLLEATLAEEKAADEKLNKLAQEINLEANVAAE